MGGRRWIGVAPNGVNKPNCFLLKLVIPSEHLLTFMRHVFAMVWMNGQLRVKVSLHSSEEEEFFLDMGCQIKELLIVLDVNVVIN